jgi:hypothetical protein
MKLSGHALSIITALAAAAASLAADHTLPHSWQSGAQTFVVIIAALLAPSKKP